jgi:hypothetical protein
MTSSTSNPSIIPNPVTGRGNVLVSGVGLANSYGLVYAVSRAPIKAGKTVATFPYYEDQVFELWVTHTLGSGLVIISQHFATRESNGIVLWENLLPSSIVVDVFPNYEVTLEWLVGI